MTSPLVTIKEIAHAAGVSQGTVRRKTEVWGLDQCISKAIKNPVCFFREQASKSLLEKRVILKPL